MTVLQGVAHGLLRDAEERQLGIRRQTIVFRHAAQRQARRHGESLGGLLQQPFEGRDEAQIVEDGRPEAGAYLAQFRRELAGHAVPVAKCHVGAAAEQNRLLQRSVMEVARDSPAFGFLRVREALVHFAKLRKKARFADRERHDRSHGLD